MTHAPQSIQQASPYEVSTNGQKVSPKVLVWVENVWYLYPILKGLVLKKMRIDKNIQMLQNNGENVVAVNNMKLIHTHTPKLTRI